MRWIVAALAGTAVAGVGWIGGRRSATSSKADATETPQAEPSTLLAVESRSGRPEMSVRRAPLIEWRRLLRPTKIAIGRPWKLFLLALLVVTTTAMRVALDESSVGTPQRVLSTVVAVAGLALLFFLAPRIGRVERATHGRVRRRIGHLGRWFGLVAGPRLFLIAVLLYVIFGCYVLTQVHDLQDRDVGVLSSIIGAAYVAVFIAVVEMTITYQKKLSMLKSQVQTPLRLLQRGIYLSAETVDHLFDTLAAGPGHEWTLTGIIDPRRAAAASRIYRVTGSSVELQPIVAEALHTLRIPTDPEARSLARWSAKGLTGKQSTEQWHTIVAAYVASTRCTPRTLELAGEWVSQPSSGPPPLEQLGASLSDEAPQP